MRQEGVALVRFCMRIFFEIRVPLVVGVGLGAGSHEDGREGNRGGGILSPAGLGRVWSYR
jgi:hypothetical protein